MKPFVAVSIGFVLLLASVGCNDSAQEAQARATFDAYIKAIQDRDGNSAADLVTPETLAYYQKLVDISLDYSEEQTKALPLADKVTVVITRHRIEHEELRRMSGRDLFMHGATHGWVGDDSMNKLTSGEMSFDFEINGEEAWCSVTDTQSGARADKLFRLVKLDGRWKLDVMHLLRKSQPEMRRAVLDTGMRENEFIELVAGFDSDRPVTEKVWQPVGR